MNSGIYRLYYKENITIYVGSSIDLKRREGQHFNKLKNNKHHNFIVQRVFNKYPEDVHFEIIHECDNENLCHYEDYYIDKLKPFANISDSRGAHPHTETAKEKMRGRFVSEETKEKLSLSHSGKPNGRKGIKTGYIPKSAFKEGTVPWNKGKKLKPSWNSGKELTDEHKTRLAETKRNKENLIGMKYKNWEIKDYGESHKGRRTWLCECECGHMQIIRSARIKSNQNIVCENCKSKGKDMVA